MGKVSILNLDFSFDSIGFLGVILIFGCDFDFRGSPNIEMDEHTFLVNRERAVDYLNSLEKVQIRSSKSVFLSEE